MKSLQLTIAEPCHENWDGMLPENQGKFCLSCQKTVVDFSAMSDREVLNYFNNNTGNTCGRFNDEQLNKTLSVPKERSIGKWKYFWQFLLPAMFAMHKVQAQKVVGKPAIVQQKPVVEKPHILMGMVALPRPVETQKMTIVEGIVVDVNGRPLAGATVKVSDSKTVIATNQDGKFSLLMKENQLVNISYVGYETKCIATGDFIKMKGFSIGLRAGQVLMSGMEIPLKMSDDNLMGVVVVGYGITNHCRSISGGVSIVRKKSIFSFATKKPATPAPTQIKIFPNPISPGQSFKIAITVPKADDYRLQIIDASGKLVHTQTISMKQLQQTETIDGHRFQQSGTYIVHLTNDKNENVFNGKLVVL